MRTWQEKSLIEAKKRLSYIKMDYKKLGFKCGLEIHQQLEGKKLFCACPTINSNEKADILINKYKSRLQTIEPNDK